MHDFITITPDSELFPEPLKHIPDPPLKLYVRGNLAPLMSQPRLAIVGSRKVTVYGRQVTSQLAREAAAKGIVIISGLALGVDGIAHQGALEANGKTVAVLPCGLDKIYPATHHQLALKIIEQGGVLISEYPPDTLPFQTNFIARNRLVSGLSDALLITEATFKSGTLHTANFALDQGKTIMAVPGNITSPQSVGTNNLIRSGAIPVTEVSDIFHAMNLKPEKRQRYDIVASSKEEMIILELLVGGLSDGGELLVRSLLDPRIFNQTLTMLEINGKIRPLGAGHWAIK